MTTHWSASDNGSICSARKRRKGGRPEQVAERAYLPIGMAELNRLADLAAQDREHFFARHPRWARLYGDRVLCVALCQGAALHCLDGRNGIKDWDVWTFYRRHPAAPFPARRIANLAFGDPRFGRSPGGGKYIGRRVDLIGRAISAEEDDDPVLAALNSAGAEAYKVRVKEVPAREAIRTSTLEENSRAGLAAATLDLLPAHIRLAEALAEEEEDTAAVADLRQRRERLEALLQALQQAR